jgi:hypothetical protein
MEQIEFEEQHPIPQQISAYHFRLVGDMTLKQFFEVAGGAIIALIIYSTNLHAVIKIPLILLSLAFGAALAFVPLMDRPLEKWIYLFFKSIYSPTLFVWKKSATTTEYFRPEDQGTITPITPQQPKGTDALIDQPAATPAQAEAQEAMTGLEVKEQEFLSKVGGTPISIPTTQVNKPTNDISTPAKEVVVPKQEPVGADKISVEDVIPSDNIKADENNLGSTRKVAPFAQENNLQVGVAPNFMPEASPPTPPTQPNIIVGQVTDVNGKIIDNAIMDIRDEYSRPARALKSNKLGHFTIATPLTDGKYNMTIDKDGFVFDTISFEAKGEIIPPMLIIGKLSENQDPGQNSN